MHTFVYYVEQRDRDGHTVIVPGTFYLHRSGALRRAEQLDATFPQYRHVVCMSKVKA